MPVTRESFYFESRAEDREVHALKWLPPAPPKAILILVHGMAEYIERYDDFARFLAKKGVLVAGCDFLGHGLSVNGGHEPYGYFCPQDPATVIIRDVHRLKKMMETEYPGIPCVIMGHSMGSFVVRNYIARYGTGVKAAILSGTGMPTKMLIGFSRFLASLQAALFGDQKTARLLHKLAFGPYNSRIREPLSPNSWLSFNTENVKKYDADPLCGFTFSVNGYLTLFELIHRLQQAEVVARTPASLPVFLFSGQSDPVGDYGKGVRLAKKSLQEAGLDDITVKLYPWARHEALNETEKAEAYIDISEWLSEKLELDLETLETE